MFLLGFVFHYDLEEFQKVFLMKQKIASTRIEASRELHLFL